MTQNSIEQYNTNSSKVLKSRKYFHLNEYVWCVITLDFIQPFMGISVLYSCPLYFLLSRGGKKIT